jgi:glycosyltransferase involved in cell wall biosynthesis
MPFPSPQGTQGAVRAMVEAEHAAGWRPTLLTYRHGAAGPPAPFAHRRLPSSLGDRSLRSGPSLRKVGQDLGLALTLAVARPPAVVAHHVEAAAAARLSGTRRWVFVAHTSLREELPLYLPERWGRLAGAAGGRLDGLLGRSAGAVAAVSPRLARLLEDRLGRPVAVLPIPWAVPPPLEPGERAEARVGLDVSDRVVLYAGNLDAYQGLETLLDALARRPTLTGLFATESDPTSLLAEARARGVAAHVWPLATEADRRRAHAAADVVCVPRRAPGGLPVKLLDALARGVPVVAVQRASAGLPVGRVARLVPDDDPEALTAALTGPLPEGAAGPSYVRAAHGPGRYLQAMAGLLGSLR